MHTDETHFLLALSLLSTIIYGSPVPTIFDTDLGTAYDDHLALTYILSRRDLFHLKLILCTTSNTTARASIVAKILSFFNPFDVPIAIGQNTKDENNIFQYEWAKDYSLEKFQADGGIIFLNGEQSLISEMNKASASHIYHYIQLGPATSLGHVLERQPSLAMHIRLFTMAGSLYRGYGNSNLPSKEYNVEVDIQSAQIMFSSHWAYFGLAPLDCTSFMQFNGLVWQTFLSYINISSTVKMIIDSYTSWYNHGGKDMGAILPYGPQTGTPEMHDILAVFLAGSYSSVSPTVSTWIPLFVTEVGFTRVNQSVDVRVNSCFKYDTFDPYTATAQIGSAVLRSITKQDSAITNAAYRRIACLQLLVILPLRTSIYVNDYR